MKGLDPGGKGLHFIEVFKAREQMAELWYGLQGQQCRGWK